MESKYSILNNNFTVKHLKDKVYILSFHDLNKHYKINEFTLFFIRKWQKDKIFILSQDSNFYNELINSELFYDLTTYENKAVKNEKNVKYIRFKVTILPININKIVIKPLTIFYNKIFVFTLVIIFFLLMFWHFHNSRIFYDLSGITISYYIIYFLISIILHEYGHLSAMYIYTKKIAIIGFGIYFFSPVLYSDTSMAWSLKRKEQLVVNFGGIYFEFILFVFTSIIFFILNTSYIFYFFPIFIIRSLHNLNPFIRSDGYWILADIIKSTNLRKDALMALVRTIKTGKIDNVWIFIYALSRYLFIFMLVLYIMLYKFNSVIIFPKDVLLLLNKKISFNYFINHHFLNIILYTILLSWFYKTYYKKIKKLLCYFLHNCK